ncbi:GFA family protein [Undibacterium sp. JH2W]|uniref:GFA family protein n=1 Tax=Undibacterium sp. JH2W TaxID=3413037 RepID=UPI003BF06A84
MVTASIYPLEGGCDCGHLRYRLLSEPLIVHCCHCRWCQRESGAAFALNAVIEADRLQNVGAEPEMVDTPSASGKGQLFARCPTCRVAIWSNYAGAGPLLRFVRVGTLDRPDHLPPDIHIYTESKQPWVKLVGNAPVMAQYYDREQYWSAASLTRRVALLPHIQAYQASLKKAQL